MAFPATSVIDDFNRANSGTLGANWTVGTRPAWNTDWTISSNQALGGSVNSDYYNVATYGDVEAYFTIGATGTLAHVLLWRITTPNSTAITMYQLSLGGAGLQVYRWDDSSTATQLGSDISVTVSLGDSLGISHIGSAITVYYKSGAGAWSSVGTFTDGTYTSGYLGIKGGDLIDNFGGGTASAGSTVALTGVSATSSVGSLTPSNTHALTGNSATSSIGTLGITKSGSLALTGVSATGSAGTLAPSTSLALSGNAATASAGSLGNTHSLTLNGAQATSSAGTLTPSLTVSLTGQGAAGSVGTLTASVGGNVTVGLTGVSATGSAGSLTPSLTRALTGSSATSSVGVLALSASTAISGQQATASTGSLSPQRSVSLTGAGVIGSAGSVQPASFLLLSGNAATANIGTLSSTRSVGITGVSATSSAGTLFVGPPPPPPPTPPERIFQVGMDSRTLTIPAEARVIKPEPNANLVAERDM